jgi:hypothetical protein
VIQNEPLQCDPSLSPEHLLESLKYDLGHEEEAFRKKFEALFRALTEAGCGVKRLLFLARYLDFNGYYSAQFGI